MNYITGRPRPACMSDLDTERERIRERRKQELLERIDQDQEPIESTPESPTEPISLTDATHLDDIVSTYDLVLIDCYADWCGPCQMLEPTIDALAANSPATVAKVDVDRLPGVAQQLGARGVPTLVLFANGDPIERVVGVQDPGALEQLIDRHS